MTQGERTFLLPHGPLSDEPPQVNLLSELIKKTAPNLLSQISVQTIGVVSWRIVADLGREASVAMMTVGTLQTFFNSINSSASRYLNALIGVINGEREGELPAYLAGKPKEEQLAVITHSALGLAFAAAVVEGVALRFVIPLWLEPRMPATTFSLTKSYLDIYAWTPYFGLANQIFKYVNQSTGAERLNYLPNIVRFSFVPLAFLLPRDSGLGFIAKAGLGAAISMFITNLGLRKKFKPESLIISIDKRLWFTSTNVACIVDLFRKGFWYVLQEIGPVWFDLVTAGALISVSDAKQQSAFGEMVLLHAIISLWGFGAFSPGINLAAEFKDRLSAFSKIHFSANLVFSGLICSSIWAGKHALISPFSPDEEVESLVEDNLDWLTVKSAMALPAISFMSILMGGFGQYKQSSFISIASFVLGSLGIIALTLTDNLDLSSALVIDSMMNLFFSLLTLRQCEQASRGADEGGEASSWFRFFNTRSFEDRLSQEDDSSVEVDIDAETASSV